MTNTHRKTTKGTTAKVAAVGAFGIGAAIAFPGLAAAQDAGSVETPDAGSVQELPAGSGVGTDLEADLGSLTLDLNLDAETGAPSSVEFGSLGVSPNTGSALVDGDLGEGSSAPGSSEEEGDDATSGSLDTGSLGGATGSLPGSSEEAPADDDATDPPADGEGTGSLEGLTGALPGSSEEAPAEPPADDEGTAPEEGAGSLDTGSLTDQLAGLSSGAEGDDATADTGADTGATVEADAAVSTGSLG